MVSRIVCLAVLCSCTARPVGRPSGAGHPAWHIVLHQTAQSAAADAAYRVNIVLVPPDGSSAVYLREMVSTEPCFAVTENQFCVRGIETSAAPPQVAEWGVTCGGTRVHVLLEQQLDRLTVGRSDAKTDFCTITAGIETMSARGAVALAGIPWTPADGPYASP